MCGNMDPLTPRSFQDLGEGMRLTSASWTGDMGISLLRNLSFAVTSNSEIFSSVQEMKTYVVVRVHRTANAKRTA